MYVIVAYDTESKNCPRLHKCLKGFLNWNQNSVFAGELTEGQFFELRKRLEAVKRPDTSITVFHCKDPDYLKRETIGSSKAAKENFF